MPWWQGPTYHGRIHIHSTKFCRDLNEYMYLLYRTACVLSKVEFQFCFQLQNRTRSMITSLSFSLFLNLVCILSLSNIRWNLLIYHHSFIYSHSLYWNLLIYHHLFTFLISLQVTEPYGYRNSKQKHFNKSHKHNVISNVNIINNINNTYLLIISNCKYTCMCMYVHI